MFFGHNRVYIALFGYVMRTLNGSREAQNYYQERRKA